MMTGQLLPELPKQLPASSRTLRFSFAIAARFTLAILAALGQFALVFVVSLPTGWMGHRPSIVAWLLKRAQAANDVLSKLSFSPGGDRYLTFVQVDGKELVNGRRAHNAAFATGRGAISGVNGVDDL